MFISKEELIENLKKSGFKIIDDKNEESNKWLKIINIIKKIKKII
jgi:hypothetical protein